MTISNRPKDRTVTRRLRKPPLDGVYYLATRGEVSVFRVEDHSDGSSKGLRFNIVGTQSNVASYLLGPRSVRALRHAIEFWEAHHAG